MKAHLLAYGDASGTNDGILLYSKVHGRLTALFPECDVREITDKFFKLQLAVRRFCTYVVSINR